MTGTLLIISGAAFLLTLGLIPLLRDLARKRSWLDLPSDRKRHTEPIPFIGGWVFFVVFWLGISAALIFIPEFKLEFAPYIAAIFLAHLLVFAGGAFDDFTSIEPPTKLLIQVASAIILWCAGLQIHTVYVPFIGSLALAWPFSLAATVFWVTLIINAVNFVDGMDGLAGGLSILTAVGLLYTSLALHINVVAVLSVLVIVIVLPFLRYNFPTATVFMGNSGSQTLGFIFALAAIYCPIKSYTVVAMFVPLLTMGVPLVEVPLTFFRRLLTGKSITRGDYGHLFHLLHRRGISKFKTVLIFWGVAAGLQIFAFTLFLFDRRIVFSILVLFMLIVAGWFLLLFRKEER